MLLVGTPRRPRATGRLVRVGVAVCLVVASIAAPAPAGAANQPFEMDLGARTDFVPQTNFVQCVGASMQIMLNMLSAKDDRTAATQLRLQRLARQESGPPRAGGRERQGASVRGWAKGLNLEGAGPYHLVGTTTIDEALLAAARAMRTTGKPVGLLMWRGRHAWVMSGFRATGDPLVPGARVTGVYVEDPLYPHGSSVWGPSPAPGEYLTIAELARQYVPRRQSTRFGSALSGKYVLVLPYTIPLKRLRQV